MKKVVLFFSLIVGLLTSASTAMAQVNMSRYITLTVKKDSAIKLDFVAAAAATPVRIVSGSNTQDITVGGWVGTASYTAYDTTMTVYGDITGFNCSNNGANLTALDLSHNTQLTYLNCSSNTLSSLDISNNTQLTYLNCSFNKLNSIDISNNTQLTELDCSYNTLSSLDVSNNTQLDKLYCCGNKLTSLDVSNNTQLTHLNCYYNPLSSLDVSNNTQLKELYCHRNQLSSLDVSNNTQLKELICWGNNFSTQVLDDIYCALPVKQASDNAIIQPIYSNTSSNHAIVLATNKTNATAKNWKVQYTKDNADIATTGIYVCGTPHPVDTSRYITLTVKKDSAIKLSFKAAADDTPIRIVSGSTDTTVTVGTSWIGTASYTAGSSTMTVYGDLKGFDCRNNGLSLTAIDISKNEILTKLYCNNNKIRNLDISKNTELEFLHCINNLLTTLDVSRNTKLEVLCCNGNDLSTQTLDDIYCALPDRTGKDNGAIYPVSSDTSSNHAIVLATNKANAIAKNWKVQYFEDDTEIPATTGSYVCGGGSGPNMSRYITLTVKNGEAIKLDFKAAAAGTPVRIVSGSNTQNITVGTDWADSVSYTAGSTTVTIYGDITGFSCSGNGANLTALDLSQNTLLTELGCSSNRLTALDLSQNTQLIVVDCSSNRLAALDLSHNTHLELFFCYGNQFNTSALDDIFCSLHDRTGDTNGYIVPLKDSSDPNHATSLATNKANATAKNWKALYSDGNTDIPATTGSYVCGTPHTDIAEASAEPSLTFYPNPVADVLYLSATARTIRVYDMYGTEVAHATDTDRIDVAYLPAGVYTVKADGTVAKMVKR